MFRTWIYPLHAVWVCIAIAHAQAVAYGAIGSEVVTSPAGIGDDCVCGDEDGEEGEEDDRGEEAAQHDGEELRRFMVCRPRFSMVRMFRQKRKSCSGLVRQEVSRLKT